MPTLRDENGEVILGMEVLAEYETAAPERDQEELQSLVRAAIKEAQQWRQEHLDPEQEKATDYYMGRPFGNEVEGRSKVVATTVRDTVVSIMPSLLRIFFGPERVVEFRPQPGTVEQVAYKQALANQQTDYINYIVTEDNKGFLAFHSAFKDALIRKTGIIKFWWDDTPKIEGATYTGLTEEQMDLLLMDGDVEIVDQGMMAEAEFGTDPETGEEVIVSPALYEVEVRRVVESGRVKIAAIPPEEFLFSPSARSLDTAPMVAHVRDLSADEVIAQGVDREVVERAKGRTREHGLDSMLDDARRVDGGARKLYEDEQDEATRPVQFADVYMRVEVTDEEGEGTGVTELRHIRAVGDAAEIVFNEPVDCAPFALFGPDPEPHTIVGLSVADYVKDLQEIESAITRGMLDSLSLSLNPATEVVEGEVNMKDLLNNEVGRVIRTRRPGQMREVVTPFVGREALPVLEYFEAKKESRTGQSRAALGLDADALQSSTKAAVMGTLSASQQRIEMIARIFAETGMTELYRGILKLVVQNQDRARVVRLRGEYVEVDPRHWDANLDVVVNVALGAGTAEEKIATLSAIAEKQEQMLQTGAPLTGFAEYRHTLGRIVELAGYRNTDEFFRPWTQEQDAELEQARAQEEPEPDANAKLLAEVEMQKIQARMQEKEIEAQLKQAELASQQAQREADLQVRLREIELRDSREREKIALDHAIKQAALRARFETDVNKADLDAARLQLDAEKAGVDAVERGIRIGAEVSADLDANLDTL
jgi:hypothetical protein